MISFPGDRTTRKLFGLKLFSSFEICCLAEKLLQLTNEKKHIKMRTKINGFILIDQIQETLKNKCEKQKQFSSSLVFFFTSHSSNHFGLSIIP